jgi:hypothetical protein
MRRIIVLALAFGTLALLTSGFTAEASAATTVPVSMSFTEPINQDINGGCPVLGSPNGGLCGSGSFVPYGHATETIVFGAGCGGTCDLRTVTVASGSIVMDEQFSNPQCPGTCKYPSPGRQGSGTLTDVVVGGTGIFAGASGNLSGTVKGSGLQSQIKLSGSITLAT